MHSWWLKVSKTKHSTGDLEDKVKEVSKKVYKEGRENKKGGNKNQEKQSKGSKQEVQYLTNVDTRDMWETEVMNLSEKGYKKCLRTGKQEYPERKSRRNHKRINLFTLRQAFSS